MVGQDDNEELGLHPWVLPKASLVSRLLLIANFYHVLLSIGVPLRVFAGWLRQQEKSQDQNGENTNIPWTESILLVLCTEVLCGSCGGEGWEAQLFGKLEKPQSWLRHRPAQPRSAGLRLARNTCECSACWRQGVASQSASFHNSVGSPYYAGLHRDKDIAQKTRDVAQDYLAQKLPWNL